MTNRQRIWIAACLITTAGIVAYWNSFDGVFLYDDFGSIAENQHIRKLWPLSEAMSFPLWQTGATVDGRPVLSLSFALNYAVFGPEPWGYHLVNLSIHIIAGLLLFDMVRRTLELVRTNDRDSGHNSWLAMAVSLIWVVHPIHPQSVTYVVQRAEVLMGMLFLLTVYSAIRSFTVKSNGLRTFWYTTSVVACAVGIGVKEVIAVAPIVVLLYDYVFISQGHAKSTWRRRPGFYAALLSPWLILAILMWSRFPDVSKDFTDRSPWRYAMTQCGVILHYLQLSIWPSPLVLSYGWPMAERVGEVIISGIIVAVLVASSAWAVYRRHWIGFVGAWFFLILGPSSSFAALAQNAFQHRMYLSLAGVVTLLVLLADYFLRQQLGERLSRNTFATIGCTLLAVVVGTFTLMTLERNEDYHNRIAFWQDNIRKRPQSFVAENNLGTALMAADRWDEAFEHYRRSLEINPNHAIAHNNCGNAYHLRGNFDAAVRHYQEASRLQPQNASIHNNWGELLNKAGRFEEAILHFQKTLDVDATNAPAHYNWGNALNNLGRYDEAIDQYNLALQIEPQYQGLHTNLGFAWHRKGNLERAMQCYRTSLEIAPGQANAHSNLAAALLELGQVQLAASHYRKALKIEPNSMDAHVNLGKIHSGLGNVNIAIAHYEDALQSAPERTDICIQLAALYNQQGAVLEATACLKKALASAIAAGDEPLVQRIQKTLEGLGHN